MTIELAMLISIVSLAFGMYQGISSMRRQRSLEDKSEATQLTTVIVKLENISIGITEIKNELISVKADIKEARERLVITEEIAKQAHKRLDECTGHCKKTIEIGRI